MSEPKPSIPEVIGDFAAYYARNPEWGSLHIVLADHNNQDCHADFCIDWARRNRDGDGERLAVILRRMSRTQRERLARDVCKLAVRSGA
jgi:hypothetical protein